MAGQVMDRGPRKPKVDPIAQLYGRANDEYDRQTGDYTDIMKRFRDIYDTSANPTNGQYKFDPYTAAQATYSRSPDTTAALASLNELSRTGGLSDTDQQNLRARGVSPIRAQYATAQRDMDRQRRLNGGYSPNFGAVTAKMTRDQSSLIADQMDKVNANIAQMVQSGKLSAAPNYASAAQAESELKNKFELENTNAKNEANRFNASGMFESRKNQLNDRLSAAQGMTSLYGTTPARSSLYNNNALDNAQFQNNVTQQKKNSAIGAFGRMYRA
jgi:hypothetical protein